MIHSPKQTWAKWAGGFSLPASVLVGLGTGRCEFASPLVTFLLHIIYSQLVFNFSGRIPGWSGRGEERSHSASCWPHAVRLEFPLIARGHISPSAMRTCEGRQDKGKRKRQLPFLLRLDFAFGVNKPFTSNILTSLILSPNLHSLREPKDGQESGKTLLCMTTPLLPLE